MAAVATFDADGLWLSTSVCEGAACPAAASVGMRWGRWVDGPEPGDAVVDHAKALVELRRQLGAHVSERVRFSHSGYDGAHPRPQELTSEDAVACVFLKGTALLSVRTSAGFTGVLCEAGDWVWLPAGVPHVFDAGESPDVVFLRQSAGRRGWFPLHTGRSLPPGLPPMEAFVEHLLHELGEDIEGSEA
jgi:1,2-dihydroxy-3-keto-5-methylthiopentene dioxygenase